MTIVHHPLTNSSQIETLFSLFPFLQFPLILFFSLLIFLFCFLLRSPISFFFILSIQLEIGTNRSLLTYLKLNFPWFIPNLVYFTIFPITLFLRVPSILLQLCKLCLPCKQPRSVSWRRSRPLEGGTRCSTSRVVLSARLTLSTICYQRNVCIIPCYQSKTTSASYFFATGILFWATASRFPSHMFGSLDFNITWQTEGVLTIFLIYSLRFSTANPHLQGFMMQSILFDRFWDPCKEISENLLTPANVDDKVAINVDRYDILADTIEVYH